MGSKMVVDHPDIYSDAGVWNEAGPLVRSAQQKQVGGINGAPTMPADIQSVTTRYSQILSTANTFFQAGLGQCEFLGARLKENAGVHWDTDQGAGSTVTNAGPGGGGGGNGSQANGGAPKYHHKLEGHIEEQPGTPEHPNNPKDDKIYDRLEELVNGLLEQDGVRINALDTDDAFDQSHETVVAYTDADGKVHVISTNPNQGTHASGMTISFLDENGNMHVVTSVDGQLVQDTVAPNGTAMERRVVMQGSLDQMMAEAEEVSIAYTDDKGVEHVVSTDKDQGGQMSQVVVAYADENGQQHMVSNETGIDTPPKDSPANQHLAYGQLQTPQFTAMPEPSTVGSTGGRNA